MAASKIICTCLLKSLWVITDGAVVQAQGDFGTASPGIGHGQRDSGTASPSDRAAGTANGTANPGVPMVRAILALPTVLRRYVVPPVLQNLQVVESQPVSRLRRPLTTSHGTSMIATAGPALRRATSRSPMNCGLRESAKSAATRTMSDVTHGMVARRPGQAGGEHRTHARGTAGLSRTGPPQRMVTAGRLERNTTGRSRGATCQQSSTLALPSRCRSTLPPWWRSPRRRAQSGAPTW